MSDGWLALYHRLPPALQSVAVSLRGWRLERWRYGPETERLVAEALERERWPAETWSVWQAQQLSRVLAVAARDVPHYRTIWKSAGVEAPTDQRSLSEWPVLEKETLRQHPRRLLADGCSPESMYEETTSGTTGKPLRLWCTRATLRYWYALVEARWRRWYGVSRHDRWAILGGKHVAPSWRQRPPFWVWNSSMRQLYLSVYHMAPENTIHYLEALSRFRIRYVYAYTSAVHALAVAALRDGLHVPRMAAIIANAEPVRPDQRRDIEAAFGCPVRETYGMSEMAAAASECEYGALHLWPEAGVVEVMEGTDQVAAGQTGDLVCTSLVMTAMPLIRYRVGDRGALAPPSHRCPCGRTLPILLHVEGRCEDYVYHADGRTRVVGAIDCVLGLDTPVVEAQFVQRELGSIHVRYVPAPEFTERTAGVLRRRVRERLGDVRVSLEPMSAIPRGANGKFRAVVCEIPPEQRPDRGELAPPSGA